jgi:thiamine-monophosphate kinase
LFGGLFELGDKHEVSIIGGDTSLSRDSVFIDVSVIGECESGRAVTRRGAKVGDRIYVSGSLGASALGLSLLEGGLRLDDSRDGNDSMSRQAINKHLVPEPQLKLGRALGEAGLATAMIDISDGLTTDLSHILDESDRGAIIHGVAIPIAECVSALAIRDKGIDPLSFALDGGEEYELLFTVKPENQERAVALSNAVGARITEIGEIVVERGMYLEQTGVLEVINPSGFEHLI